MSSKKLVIRFYKRTCIIAFLLCTIGTAAYAQGVGEPSQISNISAVKVDALSDNQLTVLLAKSNSMGMDIESLCAYATTKGMPQEEVNKLKTRLTSLQNSGTKASLESNSITTRQNFINTQRNGSNIKGSDSVLPQKKITSEIQVFGASLFKNSRMDFAPNVNLPLPPTYILGADDKITIVISGVQENTISTIINSDGSILLPNIGLVPLTGLTVAAATNVLQRTMSTVYRSLQNNTSKLQVVVTKVKGITVNILGNATIPGNYVISSLSTAFNALFLCGGPNDIGSYREIKLLRKNKLIEKIDLYKFLVDGDESDNIALENGDIIFIPTYTNRVTVDNFVKHPAIFEILPNETFTDVLRFASGFTDNAYQKSIKVTQMTEDELSIKDLYAKEFSAYHPKTGDVFSGGQVLTRYANRVQISGAVYRPGQFQLSEGITLAALIENAGGVRQDAYTQIGEIYRLNPDLTMDILPFSPKDILNKKEDIELRREDSVVIKSLFDLKYTLFVTVQGEVRAPGIMPYRTNLTLKDLLFQAGFVTDIGTTQKIEIARPIKHDTISINTTKISELFTINDTHDLTIASNSFHLEPFDIVTVRRFPGYTPLTSVIVSGELQYTGPYVLSTYGERVSDIIERAGGVTASAYLPGAYIKRYAQITEGNNKENIQKATGLSITTTSQQFDRIPLDLVKIFKNKHTIADIMLQGNDELIIPKYKAEVKISGSVLSPTQIPYVQNKSLKWYLNVAGGVSRTGAKRRTYVVYANGKAAATKTHLLFFRSYPKIKPGSEVIVPINPPSTLPQTMGLISGIAATLTGVVSTLGVIIALKK